MVKFSGFCITEATRRGQEAHTQISGQLHGRERSYRRLGRHMLAENITPKPANDVYNWKPDMLGVEVVRDSGSSRKDDVAREDCSVQSSWKPRR